MNLQGLKAEFRLTYDGDDWGHVTHWLFSIADEIYFNRDFSVPAEWKFRPSPLGPSNDDDDYTTQCVREADDASLLMFGKMMNRATRLLTAQNCNY
jgi:hypothetical protein